MKNRPNKIISQEFFMSKSTSYFRFIVFNIMTICLFLIPLVTFSQKHHKNDEDNEIPKNRSWSFSINTGVAFANKYHANFYNGAKGNQNELSYVFDNKYWNQEIRRAVNDTFSLYGMPTNMRYDPAFCVGFSIKKKFNNHVGAFAQFNFSRLKAHDVFTLKIGATPLGSTTNVNLRNYSIWGKEDRINIDLGVSGEIALAKMIGGFLEGGLNINNTRVRDNGIIIESLEYSIVNVYGNQGYIPNTQQQEYKIKEGGLGIGLFLSPGVEFKFNDNVAVDVLGTVYWSKINLMHYASFKPSYNFMLRFVFATSVTVEN
jgi:hypothetical protein